MVYTNKNLINYILWIIYEKVKFCLSIQKCVKKFNTQSIKEVKTLIKRCKNYNSIISKSKVLDILKNLLLTIFYFYVYFDNK